ncbi:MULTISPECIES: preprotein translocase subunit SecE [Gammaproteobacteria]|uniref:preprotein translocase subunit SecE n=1 Tax=Gammaproteobacteria TaxID=1236 RepID=UPI000DCFBAA4|nr:MULTISPECIES: preprotein translocase subunit SecE [Gammaproteobacteria]RTE86422.1 preprotein translocase subunit SecE [Aliidiomarina sp. B3213]TCZ81684.1 preprotein translocase subunit SecE [Lysobacter sp. N42]
MSANTESQSNPMDIVKWVLAIALLAAAVVGNSYYGEVSVVFRALGVIALVAAAAFFAATTARGKQFLGFAKESRTEVRKVVWPSRKEATNTTLIVLAATLVVALILWGLDGILVRVVGFATGVSV